MFALAADLFRARDFVVARRVLEDMLAADPTDALAHLNAGRACMETGDYAAAVGHFRAVGTQDRSALTKLGSAALLDQDHETAEQALTAALALYPDDAETQHVYAALMATYLRDDEALVHYRDAQKLRPGWAEPQVGEAFCLLRRGHYREGWAKFEARHGLNGGTMNYHGLPQWDGRRRGTVILRSEMGFGDSLQFFRYIPMVAERVFEVVVETHPFLRRFVEGIPGVSCVIDTGAEPPHADAQISLMSLPHVFDTTVETIPPPVCPSLPPRRSHRGFRVGLCWQGGARINEPAAHATDKRRSISFHTLGPILNVSGVKWVSLQKDGNLLPGPIDGCRDFYDTAALTQTCDAVVTVDSAMVHLAGTVGVPTLLMHRFDTCWRWFAEREDSPWYPSVRVFRQDRLGEWGPVIEHVAEAVREMAGC